MTKPRAPKPSRALWSGRFASGPADSLREVGDSLRFDRRLVRHDLRASAAHAAMLGARRIIPAKDAKALVAELRRMDAEIEAGKLRVEGPDEDVHSWIERTLTERLGDAGRRVHTARSRNDQVATAFRLWVRDEAVQFVATDIPALQRALVQQADAVMGVVVPAYTHLQRGQPVLLSHQLLAYVEMLARDAERMIRVMDACSVLPLGSGAATGVPYPIDRAAVARSLACDVSRNSMDSVSDRDFAVEYLAALSLLQAHLSRLAEDVCLWASSEWRLLELGDEVSTGSSIMPQKRNPDGAELTRGKSGRVFGHLAAMLTTLKGLPMTYNRDLQEDKEAVFDATDTVRSCVLVMADTVARSRFREESAGALLARGHLLATELADHLVRGGLPFRDAHEAVGALVRELDGRGKDLSEMDERSLARIDPRFRGCAAALDPKTAVDRRAHAGGTATKQVASELRRWKRELSAQAGASGA
ncbi:MAG: Argininosuccinate lyase [Planctomycetes bacterium]|nr:Argininosuccinate lyase [Planctomycetota bacterium]